MFKHKCFIRKNNEFLRETLKKLGYIGLNPNDNETIIVTNDGHDTSYFTTIEENSIKNLGNMYIDCGKSETLFLGIAAITNEHDKFQFFTTLADRRWYNLGTYSPKGSLEFCMVTGRHMGKHPLLDNMTVPAKKSSIEDLMANFKDKEEDTEFYSKIPEERWKKDIYDFEYYPLTDEEKKELNDVLTKDENVECIFSSANTEV
jgi:hypothetical protein